MKQIIKNIFSLTGYEIRKINPFPDVKIEPASAKRAVGDMQSLLEDLKARGLNCNNIMDVGANRCGWAVITKSVFANANFCLIEPQLELEAEYLRPFAESTNKSIYFIAGAGSTEETKYLTIWDDKEGSSFLPEENDDLKSADKQRIINIVTIDGIIKSGKFETPELVKLDIQGFEIEALKGAESLFGKTEVFILEVSLFPFMKGMPVLSDIVNFMLQKDYVVYDFPGFLRRPKDGALGQCDICFVKKDSFLKESNEWD
jgi:FkbM family methyltransferase